MISYIKMYFTVGSTTRWDYGAGQGISSIKNDNFIIDQRIETVCILYQNWYHFHMKVCIKTS